MTAEQEYRKEPWNREKSDAYIVELENKIEELLECLRMCNENYCGTCDFGCLSMEYCLEKNRIIDLLNKYLDK